MQDIYTRGEDVEMMSKFETQAEDNFNRKEHWEIEDRLIKEDGTVETFKHVNLVVDSCSKLIAQLMRGGGTGIGYWAVGSGSSTWDNSNPPTPTVKEANLTNETFRKQIRAEDIKFIDEANKPSVAVTNRLEIKLLFDTSEGNGELREFGLFGGNATSVKGSGLMLNKKNHGLIYKTEGMRLERTIRLTF